MALSEKELSAKEETKKKILTLLPLMKEIESQGLNPVKIMLGGTPTMEEIEAIYVGLSRCKTKYPLWYETYADFVVKDHICC